MHIGWARPTPGPSRMREGRKKEEGEVGDTPNPGRGGPLHPLVRGEAEYRPDPDPSRTREGKFSEIEIKARGHMGTPARDCPLHLRLSLLADRLAMSVACCLL